jgi:hypothetical protein
MRHNPFRNHSAGCAQFGFNRLLRREATFFVRRANMTISLKSTAIAALAALSVSAAFATPAAAWCNGWGCGGGYNAGPAVAAGVLGGMALGAAAAGAAQGPVYAAPGYGGGCWVERRPVYDDWGNYIGRRRVRVCE